MGKYYCEVKAESRLLEPFCHINVVVTATEWANFFALGYALQNGAAAGAGAEATAAAMGAKEESRREKRIGEPPPT